jgi:uncharacterized protein (TIGR02757 family)
VTELSSEKLPEKKICESNIDKETLDALYEKYNDKRFIHPDPLEFLYNYKSSKDMEVAGLIASSLAYGNIKQILKSVSRILDKLGKSPSDFLKDTGTKDLQVLFSDFKHRFTTGTEIVQFLKNISAILKKYGSLNECFLCGFEKDKQMIPAILFFAKELRFGDCTGYNSLVPMPAGKCAYKRLNLYLRWMVRKDNVDPGIWAGISASRLIVPLDVHMYRVAKNLGLTSRKQADLKTAVDITRSLKKFDPEDPVKFDFALTRQGIHGSFFY